MHKSLPGLGKVIGVMKIHKNLDGFGEKVTGVVKIPENFGGVHPGAPRYTLVYPSQGSDEGCIDVLEQSKMKRFRDVS